MDRRKTEDPIVMVIFGGSGDLTWRKLIPAMYNLYIDGFMPPHFLILGLGRQKMTDLQYRKRLHEGVNKFSRSGKPAKKDWDKFSKCIQYKSAEVTTTAIYNTLKKDIGELEKKNGVQ